MLPVHLPLFFGAIALIFFVLGRLGLFIPSDIFALLFGLIALAHIRALGIRPIALDLMLQKYADGESRFMNVNGTLVHYRDQGQGPVILAIHGIVDSLHTWDGWVAEIGDRYRIIRLDLLGFGLTGGRHFQEYSYGMFVDFINQFMEKLGVDRFSLAGNSLGGAIAWNYALTYPAKVESLILVDPAGYHLKKAPWMVALSEVPLINQLMTVITPKFIYTLTIKTVFGDRSVITRKMVDRFFELSLRPGNRRSYVKIFRALLQLNRQKDFTAGIPTIKAPVLLMWGKKDNWIPVTHVAAWKRDLPAVQTLIYDSVGHVPQLEIPVRSAQDADHFLTRVLSETSFAPHQR